MINVTPSYRCFHVYRHPLAREFRHRKTIFETAVLDAVVVGRWPVFGFMYAFICAYDLFLCLITVVATL